MARIYYRKFRTRQLYASSEAFRRTIVEGFREEVLPEVTERQQARTIGWRSTPDFAYKIEINRTGVRLHVYPVGWGAQYWLWVSRGVRGHPIVRRRTWSASTKGKYRAALKLYHYVPFTTPYGFYGGPGKRTFSGYRYAVNWPGIQARLFEEQVYKEYSRMYYSTMENIVRRAVAAALREAKEHL